MKILLGEKMNNKEFITYYGEYSLYHWIELILSEEIVLPDFQRCFVWDPKRAIKLMASFDRGLFVPPIIVANFSGNNDEKPANYVLDGQQRLSAILLTFLNVFPAKFPQVKRYAVETYEEDSEYNESTEKNLINWDFNNIQDIFRNKCSKKIMNLKMEVQEHKLYHPINNDLKKIYKDTNDEDIKLYQQLNIDEEFLKARYLGYSYIKSIKPNPKNEMVLFGEIFKNINTTSVSLTNSESRSALYWASGDKKEFFEPSFVNNIEINNDKIDFVRYIALLSNVNNLMNKKQCNVYKIKDKIAIKYSRSRMFEEYILSYVDAVSKDIDDDIFGKFSNVFPNYKDDLKKLKHCLDKPQYYKSYLEADLHLFGLFYWILFKKKSINLTINLKEEIVMIGEQYKNELSTKKYNTLGAVRNRIVQSINIYSKYLMEG